MLSNDQEEEQNVILNNSTVYIKNTTVINKKTPEKEDSPKKKVKPKLKKQNYTIEAALTLKEEMYDSSRSKTSKRSSQAKQFEMLKRLNKEKLQQYKDSLDKKIKELREKIESSSSLQTTLSFKQGNCGANYYSSNNDRKHKGDLSGNQSKKMLISNLKGNVSSAFSVGTLAGGDKREMFFVGNDEKKGSLNDVISSRPNNPQNNSPKSIQTNINFH